MAGDERMERKGEKEGERGDETKSEVSRKTVTSPESSQLPGLHRDTDGGIDGIYTQYGGH